MKNNPLISVVLPTYNVAQYLQQCLESVAAQTYRNIEVIIIIDGATDGSYEIAQEFCKTDDRFNVYWQENAGSGPARNNGLTHCQGEFVMFVDPDDWIEPELLENLYEAQREGNYDLVASGRKMFMTDEKEHVLSVVNCPFKAFESKDVTEIRQLYVKMLTNEVVSAPTRKLYRHSLITEHHIDFPDFRRSQDICFNYRYYRHIRSLRTIEYVGYNYRRPTNSLGARFRKDYYKTVAALYSDILKMYDEWSMECDKHSLCNYFFKYRISPMLQQYATAGWDIKECVEEANLHEIIATCKPKGAHLKMMRLFIMLKMYRTASMIAKMLLKYRRSKM